MKPKKRRILSTESKIGLKKVVAHQKNKLEQVENAKNMFLRGANKATELFELESKKNIEMETKNKELSTEIIKLKQEVLKGIMSAKDLSQAHMLAECDWFREKAELEKEIAALKGMYLVVKDDLRQLQNRGILKRIFKVGEVK